LYGVFFGAFSCIVECFLESGGEGSSIWHHCNCFANSVDFGAQGLKKEIEMDLLSDAWIPVRPVDGGGSVKITLQELLCSHQHWQLCLPRDDMELAALQLLVSIVQVSWIPEDDAALRRFLNQPLSEADFKTGIAQWGDMFLLDHPEHPCLQVKGVAAKDVTGLEKLMAGLTGATNCTFVNEPGQGDFLCGGCAAIALFNQANNAPSFGG